MCELQIRTLWHYSALHLHNVHILMTFPYSSWLQEQSFQTSTTQNIKEVCIGFGTPTSDWICRDAKFQEKLFLSIRDWDVFLLCFKHHETFITCSMKLLVLREVHLRKDHLNNGSFWKKIDNRLFYSGNLSEDVAWTEGAVSTAAN